MEYLDWINEHGLPTGKIISREQAHAQGILHRTSHVWIYREDEAGIELLLQKRCQEKDSFPGCYDISSAGHIPAGTGFMQSALRELKEELGISAEPEELHFCGQRRFSFQAEFHGEPYFDNQISNVYMLHRALPAEAFRIQKSEIERVDWFRFDACVSMVAHKDPMNCIRFEELAMLSEALKIPKISL